MARMRLQAATFSAIMKDVVLNHTYPLQMECPPNATVSWPQQYPIWQRYTKLQLENMMKGVCKRGRLHDDPFVAISISARQNRDKIYYYTSHDRSKPDLMSKFTCAMANRWTLENIILHGAQDGLGIDTSWRNMNENRAGVTFITGVNKNGHLVPSDSAAHLNEPELDNGALEIEEEEEEAMLPVEKHINRFNWLQIYFDKNWFCQTWLIHITDINLLPGQTKNGTYATNNWSEAAFLTFNKVFLSLRKNKQIDHLAAIILGEYFPFYEFWPSAEARIPQQIEDMYFRAYQLWDNNHVISFPGRTFRVRDLRDGHPTVYHVHLMIPKCFPCSEWEQTGKWCTHQCDSQLFEANGPVVEWIEHEMQAQKHLPSTLARANRLQTRQVDTEEAGETAAEGGVISFPSVCAPSDTTFFRHIEELIPKLTQKDLGRRLPGVIGNLPHMPANLLGNTSSKQVESYSGFRSAKIHHRPGVRFSKKRGLKGLVRLSRNSLLKRHIIGNNGRSLSKKKAAQRNGFKKNSASSVAASDSQTPCYTEDKFTTVLTMLQQDSTSCGFWVVITGFASLMRVSVPCHELRSLGLIGIKKLLAKLWISFLSSEGGLHAEVLGSVYQTIHPLGLWDSILTEQIVAPRPGSIPQIKTRALSLNTPSYEDATIASTQDIAALQELPGLPLPFYIMDVSRTAVMISQSTTGIFKPKLNMKTSRLWAERNIFESEIILLPWHIKRLQHWIVIVIQMKEMQIMLADSLTHSIQRHHQNICKRVVKFLEYEHKARELGELPMEWGRNLQIYLEDKKILGPLQQDTHSCGLHIIWVTQSLISRNNTFEIDELMTDILQELQENITCPLAQEWTVSNALPLPSANSANLINTTVPSFVPAVPVAPKPTSIIPTMEINIQNLEGSPQIEQSLIFYSPSIIEVCEAECIVEIPGGIVLPDGQQRLKPLSLTKTRTIFEDPVEFIHAKQIVRLLWSKSNDDHELQQGLVDNEDDLDAVPSLTEEQRSLLQFL
ncbi:hypothetical protein M422DRAFT_250602 [Sphaerobolus stellatus SS14]|uniref:Ubiquitin-like protease family profile domain-containing protein n=1 Tax=Sphaerobolus stellatus (strain SS14) TaxID=990650 RepID=A0A0C9W3M3_SPHS4|nr:hypothetical protein M422DRAFT_250602 [Sphaerobolus stellatus SS14]